MELWKKEYLIFSRCSLFNTDFCNCFLSSFSHVSWLLFVLFSVEHNLLLYFSSLSIILHFWKSTLHYQPNCCLKRSPILGLQSGHLESERWCQTWTCTTFLPTSIRWKSFWSRGSSPHSRTRPFQWAPFPSSCHQKFGEMILKAGTLVKFDLNHSNWMSVLQTPWINI